jgi:hypothetical protein
MKGDVIRLHQFNEVLRGIARQSTAAKVRIFAEEMFVRRTDIDQPIGEIASTAARNSNFFSDLLAVIDQQDGQAQLASHTSTKKASSAGAYDHHITCLHAVGV